MVAIFVILTILTFVAVEYFRHRATAQVPVPVKAQSEGFLIPKGFFFGRNHAWVHLLYSGEARVGIDDFVQKVIGKIDTIETAATDTIVKKGEPILRLHTGARTLTVAAPIAGRVTRVNTELLTDPSILHNDPYVKGWVAEIIPNDLSGDVKSLSIAEEAAKWLRGEISRFRDFVREQASVGTPSVAGATLLDGGMPLGGVMEQFNEKTWEAFESEFLAGKRS